MVRNIIKHRNIYLFIFIVALIGFLSGFLFYNIQSDEMKENIINSVNIEEELSSGSNNIIKRIKASFFILVSGIFIISLIYNVFWLFYNPFSVGFILGFLLTYGFKFAIIYSTVYYFIPLFFLFILVRISFSISYYTIKFLILKNRFDRRKIFSMLKKYFIIFLILLSYEFLIWVFSSNINGYLMTFIRF